MAQGSMMFTQMHVSKGLKRSGVSRLSYAAGLKTSRSNDSTTSTKDLLARKWIMIYVQGLGAAMHVSTNVAWRRYIAKKRKGSCNCKGAAEYL